VTPSSDPMSWSGVPGGGGGSAWHRLTSPVAVYADPQCTALATEAAAGRWFRWVEKTATDDVAVAVVADAPDACEADGQEAGTYTRSLLGST